MLSLYNLYELTSVFIWRQTQTNVTALAVHFKVNISEQPVMSIDFLKHWALDANRNW